MGKLEFDSVIFRNLYKYSPKQAFEYRKQTTGEEIPDEYLEKNVSEEKSDLKKGDLSNSTEKSDTNYSREDLIVKLKENGVYFAYNAKTENLLKKCIENNLI